MRNTASIELPKDSIEPPDCSLSNFGYADSRARIDLFYWRKDDSLLLLLRTHQIRAGTPFCLCVHGTAIEQSA
jgi:hypothetical protein